MKTSVRNFPYPLRNQSLGSIQSHINTVHNTFNAPLYTDLPSSVFFQVALKGIQGANSEGDHGNVPWYITMVHYPWGWLVPRFYASFHKRKLL